MDSNTNARMSEAPKGAQAGQERTLPMSNPITPLGVFRLHLDRFVRDDKTNREALVARIEDGFALGALIESADGVLVDSYLAHHATALLRHIELGEADGSTIERMTKWAADTAELLEDGQFLRQSSSLLHRAGGEAKHKALGRVLRLVRQYLADEARDAKGGAR